MVPLHPLANLNLDEVIAVRNLVKARFPDDQVEYREIGLREPPKAELLKFLDLEHSGQLTDATVRPARLAYANFDTVGPDDVPHYREMLVNVPTKQVLACELISEDYHPALTMGEFEAVIAIIEKDPAYLDALSKLNLPSHFEVVIEPWPYGSLEDDDEPGRYFQGLLFGKDTRNGNPDSNFYAFPIPLLPVVDYYRRRVSRVIELPSGGLGDSLTDVTYAKQGTLDHCTTAEYAPELLPNGMRKDFRDLNVVQPDGPSFSVSDNSLVEWQKWRFRVAWTPREGAVIHDVHYDGRSIFHRLSLSEMTVPYADPRSPYHRKQAFDFGEGGAGMCANNLALGCDCLGVIKYFDAVLLKPDGKVEKQPNVICLHEQDNGIGWKHTNWRTGRAVVTRHRELVVQFILTLANYEYIFAYKFNLSGGIDIETRATGIVSCVYLDRDKVATEYGNIVNPGVLAQNHQHIFAVRIDPAIDGHANTVIQEESVPIPINDATNPTGNWYKVQRTPLTRSQWADASPMTNRVFKMVNNRKKNPVSGKPVGYKLTPPPTQMLLADPHSRQAQRAAFAQHHVWVTKHHDGELWAAGKYPFQSRHEEGGVQDMVNRRDNIEDEDIVVWSVFCLTHNPRVEDWPVMPVEIHQISLRPVDFFTENPSIDVPSKKNLASQEVSTNGCCSTSVPAAPAE